MARIIKCSLAFAAMALVLTACSRAGELKIGDAAPGFKELIGIDGKKHGLADYKDAKLVVLVFTCNHCPVAQAYEARLIALQKQYKPKGVQLVAVNVNNLPEDRLDAMKKRAEEKDFNFPYLYDQTQKIGHDYGATVTPHVFVLDQRRKIAYIGAVDDNMDAEKVKSSHLSDALDAFLTGKKATKDTTTAFGCSIKYE
jgi:peroxiredoxin